jgi:hypothetical protein
MGAQDVTGRRERESRPARGSRERARCAPCSALVRERRRTAHVTQPALGRLRPSPMPGARNTCSSLVAQSRPHASSSLPPALGTCGTSRRSPNARSGGSFAAVSLVSRFAGRSCSETATSLTSSRPRCGWSWKWMVRSTLGSAYRTRAETGTLHGSGTGCCAYRRRWSCGSFRRRWRSCVRRLRVSAGDHGGSTVE